VDYTKLLNEFYYGGSDEDDDELYSDVEAFLKSTDSKEALHAFATEHNYDDGYEIPEMIIDNPNCDLATALTIFYDIEGINYLLEGKNADIYEKESYALFQIIQKHVYEGFYTESGEIQFIVPLTKVQVYQIKKAGLKEKDYVFIKNIEVNDNRKD